MQSDLVYLVAGAVLLLAVLLPLALHRWAVSAPLVLVAVGMLLGLTPLPDGMPLNPIANRALVEHLTELAVIIALMGVGLALDRPLDPRRRRDWQRWSPTWRLLGIAMPLGIVAVALLGWWWAGLAPAVALLLGAVLAPTDPVLASDVQVAGPAVGEDLVGDDLVGETSEVRFALTSEAGLNDGLAFPFVYLAILLAAGSSGLELAVTWSAGYVVAKIAIGLVIGVVVGRALGAVAFRSRLEALRLAERGEPLLALAALLTAYGSAEALHGYGFLAVFACGLALRAAERGHHYHRAMHDVIERLERLLTLLLLLAIGIALTRGVLDALDWAGAGIGVALVFLVRPATALLALAVRGRDPDDVGGLARQERLAVAFLGVRGVGSLYYLAYAAAEPAIADSGELAWLWSTVAFTVALSVVVHGMSSTPAMRWLDRRAQEVKDAVT